MPPIRPLHAGCVLGGNGDEMAKLMPDFDGALDRFEQLFKELNALLTKA